MDLSISEVLLAEAPRCAEEEDYARTVADQLLAEGGDGRRAHGGHEDGDGLVTDLSSP